MYTTRIQQTATLISTTWSKDTLGRKAEPKCNTQTWGQYNTEQKCKQTNWGGRDMRTKGEESKQQTSSKMRHPCLKIFFIFFEFFSKFQFQFSSNINCGLAASSVYCFEDLDLCQINVSVHENLCIYWANKERNRCTVYTHKNTHVHLYRVHFPPSPSALWGTLHIVKGRQFKHAFDHLQ